MPIVRLFALFFLNKMHYLCEDGIHPNEEGHRLIEEAIIAYLKREKMIA